MDLHIVQRGFVLGLAIAAPVGPIGLLVIRRSVAHGMLAGLSAGMGAAFADAFYAAIATLGIAAGASAVTTSLPFRVAAAVILAWLGVGTLRARPPAPDGNAPEPEPAHVEAFASTIALTLANPATLVSFAAASTAIGVGGTAPHAVLAFAAAVLAGSATWWTLLSASTGALRSRLGPRALRAVRLGAGAALLGFAVLAVLR
jgi:threonine/homoserine/homoserine lactone efflux protein